MNGFMKESQDNWKRMKRLLKKAYIKALRWERENGPWLRWHAKWAVIRFVRLPLEITGRLIERNPLNLDIELELRRAYRKSTYRQIPYVFQYVVVRDQHGQALISDYQVNWQPLLRLMIWAIPAFLIMTGLTAWNAGVWELWLALGIAILIANKLVVILLTILQSGFNDPFVLHLKNASSSKEVYKKALHICMAHWALQYRVPFLGSREQLFGTGIMNNRQKEAAMHTKEAILQLAAMAHQERNGSPHEFSEFVGDHFFDKEICNALSSVQELYQPFYRSVWPVDWAVQHAVDFAKVGFYILLVAILLAYAT